MDHRWGHRMRADLPVQVRLSSQTVGTGRLCDISISGGFIRSGAVPTLMARVRLNGIGRAGTDTEAIELEGFVVRRAPDGFAVEWVELTSGAVAPALPEILQRLGRRTLTQPEPVPTHAASQAAATSA